MTMWRSGACCKLVIDHVQISSHQRHLVSALKPSSGARGLCPSRGISTLISHQLDLNGHRHRQKTSSFPVAGWPRLKLCPDTVQLSAVRSLLVAASPGKWPSATVADAREELKSVVGSSLQWSEGRDPSVTKLTLAQDQSELTPRRMQDSYREAVIPIGQDPALRETYINIWNSVRFGRIMEDLDTMAVWISYTHCLGPDPDTDMRSPLSIVTAMVDRIEIRKAKIESEKDVLIRGHVTWVGNTSIEVTMNVKQEQDGGWRKILVAKFLMVARDPKNKVKAYVNPLILESQEEKDRFQAGQLTKIERAKQSRESLLKTPPSEEERLIVHDMFLQTLDQNRSLLYRAVTFKHRSKPENAVWMEDTLLKNIIICFPEQRNLYNKIFGGFLMRQTFELAWINACVYSKQRPYLVAVDDILFRKPVEIGSLLYMSSQVAYTDNCGLQVRVHAEVVNPQTGHHDTTNVCHVTFRTAEEPVPTVVPKSYAEYMMYLDGKRHFETNQPN